MHRIVERLAARGDALEITAERAAQMEDVSHEFYFATLPGWRRTLHAYTPPAWWCGGWWGRLCCRRCTRTHRHL